MSSGLVTLRSRLDHTWANSRGELTVPYYTAAFDLGIDALKQVIGIDAAYRLAAQRSTVALEAHLVIHAAVPIEAEVVIESRIVDCDAKRLHVAQALHCGPGCAATRESMTISFDLAARRSCPFEAAVMGRIATLFEAQRTLPPHAGTAHLLGLGRVP